MARIQPTKVEVLDLKHKGLRQCVDMMLDGQKMLEEIQAKVLSTFEEKIPLSTLSSYKQTRWLARKNRIRAIKEHAEAILQIMEGGRAITEITQALVFEKVQAAVAAGSELDPEFLLAEQRKWQALELKRQALEQAKKSLELKVQQMKQRTEEAVEEAKQKSIRGESLTVEDINKIRERVFGLPEAPAGHSA